MKNILLIFFLLFSLVVNAQSNYFYSAKKVDSTGIEKYWVFEKSGDLVFEEGFDWIHVNVWGWVFTFQNSNIEAYDSNYKKIDLQGLEEFHHVWRGTKLIPLKLNGKWGYFDKAGAEIIKPQFDDITLFENGIALVEIDQAFFYINEKGEKFKVPYEENLEYQFGNLSSGYGLTTWENYPQEKFEKAGKFGLREVKTKKVLIPAKYEGLFNIQQNQVTAVLNGKFGVLSFQNKIVIPFEYDEIIVLD